MALARVTGSLLSRVLHLPCSQTIGSTCHLQGPCSQSLIQQVLSHGDRSSWQPEGPSEANGAALQGIMVHHRSFATSTEARDVDKSELYVIPFPKLSHTMQQGKLLKWHKKPGDRINMYDVLLEVSTEQIAEDVFRIDEFAGDVHLLVESQEEGYLAAVLQQENDQQVLQVGKPVGVVCSDKADVDKVAKAYNCPTSNVYDESQPSVQVLTWQSYLKKMTRGNQRDVDRARAAKRAEKNGKQTAKDKDGLTKQQRQERDAAALQAKIAAKQAAEGK